jgi:3-hydroxy-D-aspartate aldolase
VDIAIAADRSSHLRLRGVQAYSVSGSHGKNTDERARISGHTFRLAVEARDAMASHGLHTDIVSGGSTGTWDVDLAIPDVTELQAGSYPLMDLAYQKLGVGFERAMTVMATVISANHADFVTVDAGFKAFSTDRSFGPDPLEMPGAAYRWGGDEFGYVDIAEVRVKPQLGGRIAFLPPHCDPTVNLYDRIYACRGGQVEEIWPVMDRLRL